MPITPTEEISIEGELSAKARIAEVHKIYAPLNSAINRSSRDVAPTTVLNISKIFHLDRITSHLGRKLTESGIEPESLLPPRRASDIILTIAAGNILEANLQSPESIAAAALLLSCTHGVNMRIQELKDKSYKEDHALGLSKDEGEIGANLGGNVLKQVREGKVDRLLSATIASYSREKSLPNEIRVSLTRGMLGMETTSPVGVDLNVHLEELRTRFSVGSKLLNRMPRTGMKAEDVPFTEVAAIASEVVEKGKTLGIAGGTVREVKAIVEQGNVPPTISKLDEIIHIVDKNPELKAVSFDLYDTLVQWSADFLDRYDQFAKIASYRLKKMGVNISEKQFNDIYFPIRGEIWSKYHSQGIEVPYQETVGDIVKKISETGSHLSDDKQKEISAVLLRDWYKRVELDTAIEMPGAKETIEALKARGLKVCITSNAQWSKEHVYRLLKQFGLFDKIDVISISSEMGKQKKPNNSEFFHYSWDKLGVPYNSVLHVGDSAENDYQGGINAGAKATKYENPLGAIRRLELNGLRDNNPEMYARTAVAIHEQSLDGGADAWIEAQLKARDIPPQEYQRAVKLSKEMYRRSRETLSPLYINIADQILNELNSGKRDLALSLARDGLPLATSMKLLINLEPDRYPNVSPDQIHYVYVSRELMSRSTNAVTPEDQVLRENFLNYLKSVCDWKDKEIRMTDIGTSGTTQTLMTQIAKSLGAKDVQGLYIDSPNPTETRRSFLQEASGFNQLLLEVDTGLFHLESIFSGPYESTTGIKTRSTTNGIEARPSFNRKAISPEVLTRGLSAPTLEFMNKVAMRGLLDAIRIRHRQRLAGMQDPSDREVANRFIRFLQENSGVPTDDLMLSVPWKGNAAEGGGKWHLPSTNPVLEHFKPGRTRKKSV